MEFNRMDTAQLFFQMFNKAAAQEANRIQHLQNYPIATSIVNLEHSDNSSAFKDYHPNLILLQRHANNYKLLVDSLGQAASPNHQIPQPPLLQLQPRPIEIPLLDSEEEDDAESRRIMKNHRRVRLRLKKSIPQAEKLAPGTPKFEEKFKKAMDYYASCEVYKDERIKALKNYLFNPSKNNEMPQKVDIVNMSTGSIYAHWTKQNGLGRRRNQSWVSIKRSNQLLHQEWKDIAAKIDEEQENQLRLGFIYADKAQGQGAEDGN